MGTTRRRRSLIISLHAAYYLILAHAMGASASTATADGASASSLSRGTASSDWFQHRGGDATKSIPIRMGNIKRSVFGGNTNTFIGLSNARASRANENASFLSSKHQPWPCCFSQPPSSTRSRLTNTNYYYYSPSTSMSTSSPIVASLFFKNLWRRRPRPRPRPRRSSIGLPTIKDAPKASPTSFGLDMEQELDHNNNNELFDTTLPPTSSLLQLPLGIGQGGGAMDEDDSDNKNDDAVYSNQEVEFTVVEEEVEEAEEEEEGTNDISDMNPSENEERKILIHKYQHQLLLNATNSQSNNNNNSTNNNKSNSNALTNAIFNIHKNEELTLMGVGMHPRQFAAWVQYYLLHMDDNGEVLVVPTGESSPTASTAAEPSSSSSSSSSTIIITQQEQKQELLHHNILLSNNCITTQEVEYDTSNWEEQCIPTIREYWKAGQLICEHTHLLSSSNGNYRNHHHHHRGAKSGNKDGQKEGSSSEDDDGENNNDNNEKSLREKEEEQQQNARYEEDERQYKREQFRDVLGSYAERMASIVEDEKSDACYIFPSSETRSESSSSSSSSSDNGDSEQPFNFGQQLVELPNGAEVVAAASASTPLRWNTQYGLRGWIETEYGVENTSLLLADGLLQRPEEEQLKTFQSFLDWFREHFPYFHDKCDSCGASCKDEPAPPATEQAVGGINGGNLNANHDTVDSTNNEEANGEQAIEQIDEDDFSFLGYVYPTPGERLGNASRTELYRCRSCSSFTRFPRYNKALWVTSTKRGRCGEYSMLLYRMLRSLGYEKLRWVVDWADHVWVEVWLGDQVHGSSTSNVDGSESGRWVHLDPCEAAVDIPLLYESWGKNQTFIVAFHDPTLGQAGPPPARKLNGRYTFPPVEDRTWQYTSDGVHVIQERRGISEEPVADAISEVSKNMVHLLEKMMER